MSVSLTCIGQVINRVFSFALVIERAWKITYPTMDLPVHGVPDSVIYTYVCTRLNLYVMAVLLSICIVIVQINFSVLTTL